MRCDNLGIRVQLSLMEKMLTIEAMDDLGIYGKPVISTVKLAASKREMLYQMAEAIGPVEVWMVFRGEITFGNFPGTYEGSTLRHTLEVEEVPFYHSYGR